LVVNVRLAENIVGIGKGINYIAWFHSMVEFVVRLFRKARGPSNLKEKPQACPKMSFANSYECARQSLIEPLDYFSLVHLMKRSTLILYRLGGGSRRKGRGALIDLRSLRGARTLERNQN
jgi:hypothetical protein